MASTSIRAGWATPPGRPRPFGDASSGAEPPYAVHAPPRSADRPDVQGGAGAAGQRRGDHLLLGRIDTPRGLLVSSITGLSVDPPRFLFCVRKEASSHDALLAADPCCRAARGLRARVPWIEPLA
jgi:flavin reductase